MDQMSLLVAEKTAENEEEISESFAHERRKVNMAATKVAFIRPCDRLPDFPFFGLKPLFLQDFPVFLGVAFRNASVLRSRFWPYYVPQPAQPSNLLIVFANLDHEDKPY